MRRQGSSRVRRRSGLIKDIAMAAAIAEVFVSSVHRNCRWHIMENARKSMGAFLDGKQELADDFKDCIDNSFTPKEFEQK